MQKSFYLGVDGGGSKTLAVIVDAQGNEWGRGSAGGANYAAVGLEQALQNIYTAVEQAVALAGCHLPLERAWFGLAGVDRPADHLLLSPHLQPLAQYVQVMNDAELGFSALSQATGVVLVAGTGSIALGRDGLGRRVRCGGWGHVLGDEGSGYDLGRQALQAAVRAADGRGPQTMLLDLILRHWQLQQADDLIGKVYGEDEAGDDASAIAHLSTYVFTAARQYDLEAQRIVQQGARELALAVRTVCERLAFGQQSVPLALCGGLLLHESSYCALVLDELRAKLSVEPVVRVEDPALSAARAAAGTGVKNLFKID
ncbi:MAG: ATPase [Ktedonobacteraceae bacterium]|nr:ATPase [Ktedonobacteraceae bacterium]